MVNWENPQEVISLTYSILYDVNTFQQNPSVPDKQPISYNNHYCRRLDDDEDEINQLIENLCSSVACPLQRELEDDCEYLWLDSFDIDGFVSTLEADDENPYKWD